MPTNPVKMPTAEQIMAVARSCNTANDIMRTLFPDVFTLTDGVDIGYKYAFPKISGDEYIIAVITVLDAEFYAFVNTNKGSTLTGVFETLSDLMNSVQDYEMRRIY